MSNEFIPGAREAGERVQVINDPWHERLEKKHNKKADKMSALHKAAAEIAKTTGSQAAIAQMHDHLSELNHHTALVKWHHRASATHRDSPGRSEAEQAIAAEHENYAAYLAHPSPEGYRSSV